MNVLKKYFDNKLTWAELYVLNNRDRELIIGRSLTKSENEEIDAALRLYEFDSIKEGTKK